MMPMLTLMLFSIRCGYEGGVSPTNHGTFPRGRETQSSQVGLHEMLGDSSRTKTTAVSEVRIQESASENC